jgi:4-amino-4-deoxy-L-arabinose transferase-like glycosyltransferase
MEFLLLWADELDDALAVLRHYAARILGLFVAIGLFAATGLALMYAPHVTLAVFAVVLSGTLFEAVRRRLVRVSSDRNE